MRTSFLETMLLAGAVMTGATTGRVEAPATQPEPVVFRNSSDASAAVAVGERTILVGDDETNALRLYAIDGGRPLAAFDMTAFLGIGPDHPEADIEGAARMGRRIYWITSHGRSRKGKWRPHRHRFFATEIIPGPSGPSARGVGRPCNNLATALVDDNSIRRRCPDLAESLRPKAKKSRRLAPKAQGLNIEALAAAPDGRTLYVGLRNPLVAGADGRRRAILAPLLNGAEVVDKGVSPIFGEPILWDLKGMGLRSMAYSNRHKAFFLVAGAVDDSPGWALYRWSGRRADLPELLVSRPAKGARMKPEAVVAFDGDDRLLLLSDDGAAPVRVSGPAACEPDYYNSDEGTCPNKRQTDPARKWFRGIFVTPPPAGAFGK